jgi:mono/diheme cytochrome c family protein
MAARFRLLLALCLLTGTGVRAGEAPLAGQARAVLERYCQRCHGQGGPAKGGFDYVLDRDRLVARNKVVPGKPDESELFQRVLKGEMPPAKAPRPDAHDIALLRRWIEVGAPALPAPPRTFVSTTALHHLMADDLRTVPPRQRRFIRYLTLTHLSNAGRPDAELRSCRQALARVVNSLSWHPRITPPRAADPAQLIYRIDLRDYRWQARTWERLVAVYPYRVAAADAEARFCAAATGCADFHLRGDWFVATASRGKLYYDLLEMPATDRALERLLQVDMARDRREETVVRAGFNDSGVSRNNRVIERHDAAFGAYWRSYDFKDNTGRQNIFENPLGPAAGRASFRPAGGEVIFNLPNGLHGYLLVDADGRRVEKAPAEIVSDPRRPDRQVEVGVSCMACHARGFLPKDDQVRAHVEKNPAAFRRADVEAIQALYPPAAKMRGLVERDNKRFLEPLTAAGAAGEAEAVPSVTQRFEGTVDLAEAASEVGVAARVLARHLDRSGLKRSLGPLQAQGGTVQRQVFEEVFARLVRELRPDGRYSGGTETAPKTEGSEAFTGHTDAILCVAVSPGGRLAASGSQDNSVRLWHVPSGKPVHTLTGHTAAVRCVAFAADGKRLLSGSDDRSLRLWDVLSGKELRRLTGHLDRVRGVSFAPDGRRALSAADDRSVRLWDLASGKELLVLTGHTGPVTCTCFAPDGRRALSGGADGSIRLWDTTTGKELTSFEAHRRGVTAVAVAPDGRRAVSGGEDRIVRLWDVQKAKELRTLQGHQSSIVAVSFAADGQRVLSANGQNDQPGRFLRVWDASTGKEIASAGAEPGVWCVCFAADGSHALSGGTDRRLHLWPLHPKGRRKDR